MRSRKLSCRWWSSRRSPEQDPQHNLPLRALAAGIVSAYWLAAQPAPSPPAAGQLDVSLQGSALAQQNQSSYIAGPAFQFSEFLPGLGLLSGRLEVLGRDGGAVTGDDYLQLRGPSAFKLRWNLQAGDFRVSSGMVENAFQNVYYPEITVRGFKVEADRPGWRYALFAGAETLLEGPRIPFRSQVPQSVLGASVQRKLSGRWQIGLRALYLWSSPGQIDRYPNFFPANRRIERSSSLTVQSAYSLSKSLKLYAEGAVAATRRLTPEGKNGNLSGFAGLAFENSALTVKLNYAYQTTSYLPLLGYFAGDRRGPFGEIRFRPRRWLDVFASSSAYANNLEGDPRVPVFQSRSTSAGGVLRLPWKLSLNGEMTDLRFSAGGSETTAPALSTSRQLAASLARPVKRQTIRVGYRDITLGSSGPSSRQRSVEVEDTLQLKRISLGGAVRLQQTTGAGSTATVYARGYLQAHLGPVTGFADVENGNDLLNRTLFATSNFRTVVAGVTARLWRGWDLQVEAFRNQLTTELNPESAFFQAGQGIPVQLMLSGFGPAQRLFPSVQALYVGRADSGGGHRPVRRQPDTPARAGARKRPEPGDRRTSPGGGSCGRPGRFPHRAERRNRCVCAARCSGGSPPHRAGGSRSSGRLRSRPVVRSDGPGGPRAERRGHAGGLAVGIDSGDGCQRRCRLPREWAATPGAVRAIYHQRRRWGIFLR